MEYLLDGYNIIRSSRLKDSERISTDSGRSTLLILLEEYRRKHPAVLFTVVFDGAGDGCSRGHGVRVLYSFDATADDRIVSIVAGKRRIACTVVSDDERTRYGARIRLPGSRCGGISPKSSLPSRRCQKDFRQKVRCRSTRCSKSRRSLPATMKREKAAIKGLEKLGKLEEAFRKNFQNRRQGP